MFTPLPNSVRDNYPRVVTIVTYHATILANISSNLTCRNRAVKYRANTISIDLSPIAYKKYIL